MTGKNRPDMSDRCPRCGGWRDMLAVIMQGPCRRCVDRAHKAATR